jgi:NAD(P)H-hydrate repair Nnr-like enzyme with NAD(P)H-hydrate epimerase domain
MCPITTLAARSRSDIDETACWAGERPAASAVGVIVGDGDDVGDGFAVGAAAQDAHTIAAAATTAASRWERRAAVTQSA